MQNWGQILFLSHLAVVLLPRIVSETEEPQIGYKTKQNCRKQPSEDSEFIKFFMHYSHLLAVKLVITTICISVQNRTFWGV